MATADGVFDIGEEIFGEFAFADGVDAGFKFGDAEETPFGVGDHLDESALFVVDGSVFGEVAFDVSGVEGCVFCR